MFREKERRMHLDMVELDCTGVQQVVEQNDGRKEWNIVADAGHVHWLADKGYLVLVVRTLRRRRVEHTLVGSVWQGFDAGTHVQLA